MGSNSGSVPPMRRGMGRTPPRPNQARTVMTAPLGIHPPHRVPGATVGQDAAMGRRANGTTRSFGDTRDIAATAGSRHESGKVSTKLVKGQPLGVTGDSVSRPGGVADQRPASAIRRRPMLAGRPVSALRRVEECAR